MARGALNSQINEIWKNYFGTYPTVTELRLLPYIDYTMKNERYIEKVRINVDDLAILLEWSQGGHIMLGADELLNNGRVKFGVTITRKFYDFIQEVLWLSYVNHDDSQIKSQEHCPDCGAWVYSIFDHVTGCPSEGE